MKTQTEDKKTKPEAQVALPSMMINTKPKRRRRRTRAEMAKAHGLVLAVKPKALPSLDVHFCPTCGCNIRSVAAALAK